MRGAGLTDSRPTANGFSRTSISSIVDHLRIALLPDPSSWEASRCNICPRQAEMHAGLSLPPAPWQAILQGRTARCWKHFVTEGARRAFCYRGTEAEFSDEYRTHRRSLMDARFTTFTLFRLRGRTRHLRNARLQRDRSRRREALRGRAPGTARGRSSILGDGSLPGETELPGRRAADQSGLVESEPCCRKACRVIRALQELAQATAAPWHPRLGDGEHRGRGPSLDSSRFGAEGLRKSVGSFVARELFSVG
jgi:hypothetical protein